MTKYLSSVSGKKQLRSTETEEERRLRLDKRNKKDKERRARKRELKVDNTNSTDTKRVKIQEILPSTLGQVGVASSPHCAIRTHH